MRMVDYAYAAAQAPSGKVTRAGWSGCFPTDAKLRIANPPRR